MVPWYAWLVMGVMFAALIWAWLTGKLALDEDACPDCGHHDHRGTKQGTCLDADRIDGYSDQQCRCESEYHCA